MTLAVSLKAIVFVVVIVDEERSKKMEIANEKKKVDVCLVAIISALMLEERELLKLTKRREDELCTNCYSVYN